MSPETESPKWNDENENDNLRKILIALLFLLISFGCIVCSSYTALWRIDRSHIDASMLAGGTIDDGDGPLRLAPLDPLLATEVARDEISLSTTQTPIAQGIVMLPDTPTPTTTPTSMPLPTHTATFTPTPTPTPSEPDFGTSPPPAASPTSPPPFPTNPPPPGATATSQPSPTVAATPTTIPPTATSPPPTSPPPASPSPTSPPPTSPPPTDSPPTDTPPTFTPTSTPIIPAVAFNSPTYTVNETAGSVTITVTLNAASSQMVTVNYATTDGTAVSGVALPGSGNNTVFLPMVLKGGLNQTISIPTTPANDVNSAAGSDYVPVNGTLVFAPGQTVQTFTVAINDDTEAEGSESFFVNLSSPTNATLGTPSTATVTIIDDELLTVQLSSSSYTVAENNGTVVVTATLSTISAFTVTVDYGTRDGTAVGGSDYTPVAGTLTFAPGVTSQTFTVPIIDDGLVEGSEFFNVDLSNPVNALLGAPSTATVTIIDNDTVDVQFSSSTYRVGEDQGPAVITVTLSAVSALTVTVDYATADGTATGGSDYTPVSGTLTFIPGIVNQIFTVPITNDTQAEFPETFITTLSNPTIANLGTPSTATVTIVDNDQPEVQFDRSDYFVNENGGTAIITATLSRPAPYPVSIDYASSNGTATAGIDYTAVAATLNFPPTQTSLTFTVAISNNNVAHEPDKTLFLTLSNPVSATLGATNPATLTIVNDDAPPSVSFITSTYTIYEGHDFGTGVATATILVVLDRPSAVPVTVDYATIAGGTAISGTDYTPIDPPVTLTFAPLQTDQAFNVLVTNDLLVNGDRTVLLQLSNPVSTTITGANPATLTIIDNDPTFDCITTDPPNQPNIGPPDNVLTGLNCGDSLIVPLPVTQPIVTSGDSAPDLVYYEFLVAGAPDFIRLDWVILEVGPSATGPWYTVFFWGDQVPDSNTNVGVFGTVEERNNLNIDETDLYNGNTGGITIDVDARAPAGTYTHIRIQAPDGPEFPPNVPAGDPLDALEFDSLHPLPWP